MGGLSFLTNNKGDKNMIPVLNEFYPMTHKESIKWRFGKDSISAMHIFHTKGKDENVFNESGEVVDYKRVFTFLTPKVFEIVKRWKQIQDRRNHQSNLHRNTKRKRKNLCGALPYHFPKMPDADMYLLTDKKIIEILTRKFEYLNSKEETQISYIDIEDHCEKALYEHQSWKKHTEKMFEYQQLIDTYDAEIKELRKSFDRHPEKYLRMQGDSSLEGMADDISNFIDISEYDIEDIS